MKFEEWFNKNADELGDLGVKDACSDAWIAGIQSGLAEIIVEGLSERKMKWLRYPEVKPEVGKPVLTLDLEEKDEKEKIQVDYLYEDLNGGIHWDMHMDKEILWRPLIIKSKNEDFYYLSTEDYDLMKKAIENAPQPNEKLLKLFEQFKGSGSK